MTSPITKKFLRKLLSSFHLWIFPLSRKGSLRYEVSNCRFPENCVKKLITEEKRVTLWVEFTHGNAVSQKAPFQFWSEDISFFTIALNELPNIPLQNPRQQCLQTVSRRDGWNSVLTSHIGKQSLRNLLSPYFVSIFPFWTWAPMGSQISLSGFHEKSVSKLLLEA